MQVAEDQVCLDFLAEIVNLVIFQLVLIIGPFVLHLLLNAVTDLCIDFIVAVEVLEHVKELLELIALGFFIV